LSYSQYFKEIPQYERIEKLHDIERSSFFKIMNAYQSGSYLKLRRHHESFNKDELNAIKRLQELNLIKVQDKQKSFLGRKIFYVLTSSGLFYIFSNILNYPPQLLTKYQHDIILKTLLFQYFEVETIECSTARFYSVITQYLQECCRTTLQRLDVVKKSTKGTSIPMNVKDTKILESDLRWHAKVIAFKLAIMYSESSILQMANPDDVANDSATVTMYELESTMKMILSKDNKFMQLLEIVYTDFGDGYKVLMKGKEE
jgi:hypothetical protein